MKPIIGVLPLYDEELNSIWMLPGYLDGIKEAGGIPAVKLIRSGTIWKRMYMKLQKVVIRLF